MASITRFASEGFSELRRRFRRSSLRKQLAALDAQHRAALAALGRTAWVSGLDLSAHAAVRDDIARLVSRAGELAAATQRIGNERAEWQARKQAEDTRFDALLRPVAAAQAEADAAVRTARSALADKERAVRELEGQVTRLSAELAKPPAAPGAGAAQPTADALRSQHQAALAALGPARVAKEQATAAVTAASEAAKQRADEAARIQADRKAALAPIDAELKRLVEDAGRAGQETATVGREQDEHFARLGASLRQSNVADAAVAPQVQAVDAVIGQRATTQAELDASLQLTRAMPAGTMLLFWAVFAGLPVAAIAIVTAVRFTGPGNGLLGGSTAVESASQSPALEVRRAFALWRMERAKRGAADASNRDLARVEVEEVQKDQAVTAFLQSPGDEQKRQRAVQILREDLQRLGSTANHRHMPVLMKIAREGEPELRAAAAEAMGMIGPRESEMDALVGALNDPVREVREAALAALGQVKGSERAPLLVKLARDSAAQRSQQGGRYQPQPEPDEKKLGAPLYPGATYLHYASDAEAGRAAYAAPDPLQKVLEFYAAKTGRAAMDAEGFSRAYLGATPGDPGGMRRAAEEMAAWYKGLVESGRQGPEIEKELNRRNAALQNLPLFRYNDPATYAGVRFVALEEATTRGERRAPRWAAIADSPALGRVLVELHVPPEAMAGGK